MAFRKQWERKSPLLCGAEISVFPPPSPAAGQLRLQLLGGNGKAAVAAVDEVDVLGFFQVKHQAGHQGGVRHLQTIGDAAAETQRFLAFFQRRYLLDTAIQHQAQHVVKPAEVGIGDQLLLIGRGIIGAGLAADPVQETLQAALRQDEGQPDPNRAGPGCG